MSFWRWLLQRLTALILVLGLATHILVMHFTGNSPIDVKAVAGRLHNPLWFTFYAIFLASTLFHGLNGTFGVLEDYKPSPIFRFLVEVCFIGAGAVAFIWGMYILICYSMAV
jgi:succinate dehydrogenase / fumarate reductase, membrane anchor subunit